MCRGYSLIELVVVIAIVGVIGVMGFYAFKPATEAERLDAAYKELINNLRTAQNNALAGKNNGATIVATFNAGNYVIGGVTYNLPTGVTLAAGRGTVCFVNPNATSLTCSGCAGSFSSCPVTPSVALVLNGTKTVTIEGTGIYVKRIYGL